MSKDVRFKEKFASKKSHELPPTVIRDKEQEAPKVDKNAKASDSGSQPSDWEEFVARPSFFKGSRWFT